MRHHYLKTAKAALLAVQSGEKTFEVRKNDRLYQQGDVVTLQAIEGESLTTYGRCHDGTIAGDDADARSVTCRVGFVLCGPAFGVEAGYCAFSLLPMEDPQP